MKLKTTFLTVYAILFTGVLCQAQFKTLSGKPLSKNDLDAFITQKMDSLQMPGISFAFINKGKIIYHKTAGIANIATQQIV